MKFFRLFALITLLVRVSFAASPDQPQFILPYPNATNISTSSNLILKVTDPDNNNLTVKFYARPCPPQPAAGDFTIVGIPDTQYYTGELNNAHNGMYKAQMNWIVNNRVSENIVFVEGLGDCVQNPDAVIEWMRADSCVKIIENPATTSLPFGIPFGMNVGNHDQFNGPGTATLFETFFGAHRFAGRPYYGGHYGNTNANNYSLFSAGGMDFIVINLEFDFWMPQSVISWMQGLLTTYSNRRAIIGSHTMITTAAQFNIQGITIYNGVKNYPNVFLMLCGHLTDEARRIDSLDNSVIHTLLSDYQNYPNGGDGYMRLMKFSPANNTISVKTYSPYLNQYLTDTNSQFTINYDLQPIMYSVVGTATVNSGRIVSFPYNNLTPNTCYEWYATIYDGTNAIKTPLYKFTTGSTTTQQPQINTKAFIEALYLGNGLMRSVSYPTLSDTITLELHSTVAPYSLEYSAKAALSQSGNGIATFPSAAFGKSFYVVAKHQSSLETWSSVPVLLNSLSSNYDFTTAADKAYNSNMKDLNDGRFAFYSGDVDQNGIINIDDFSIVEFFARSFLTGYSNYDINGDGILESTDYSFVENKKVLNIVVAKP